MNDTLKVFGLFLRGNYIVIVAEAIILLVFFTIFLLYSLPLEPYAYAVLLSIVSTTILGMYRYYSFYKHHLILIRLKSNIVLSDYMLPSTVNLIENDYQELIKEIDKGRIEVINEKNKTYSDMIDYYTIWAHQIKTPIAAMSIILQSEKSEVNNELLEQLFKIEQYVEMVLQYLRLEDMNSDLLIKSYSLDSIIKQAIRKYSRLFIRKRIKLNYSELNCDVLTDEKWLVFVVEQILSNSIKYTVAGEVSIYMDKQLPQTLVIEDTGMGIELEDLPRVFEKGFTGYNGRSDNKSTGIGLYLSKQILSRLSHIVTIESEIGKGTKVKIGLQSMKVDFE